MSERRMHMALAGAALTLALLATAPANAADDDCAVISANFVLCEQGTLWAEAVWEQTGDGAALDYYPYYVEFYEHWSGRTEGQTLDAALDTFLAELHALDVEAGVKPPRLLLRDDFRTESLQVVRAVESVTLDDDQPLLLATMLAEAEDARIVVVFSHDDTASLDVVRDESRAFIALIHLGEEG